MITHTDPYANPTATNSTVNATVATVNIPTGNYKIKDDFKKFHDLYRLPELFNTTEKAHINSVKEDARKLIQELKSFNIPFSKFSYIAGGFFVSKFLNEKPRDIDIFHVYNSLESDSFRMILEQEYKLKSKTDINYSQFLIYDYKDIQYIFTKSLTREEIVGDFDFIHTKVSYDIEKDILYISPFTYRMIMNRILIPLKKAIPPERRKKFYSRGWNMPKEFLIKI